MVKGIKRVAWALLILWIAGTVRAADEGRKAVNFNFGWRFAAGDVSQAEQPDFDDSQWRQVDVPHDFQIEQPWVAPAADEQADNSDIGANIRSRLSSRGFKEMGIGWYRKHFTPESSWQGKRLLLDFQGIMYVGDVYLNGQRIGGTDYGYVGFEVDITQLLKQGEENVIAVKANTQQPNNSRWYTGGGLFRDVSLIVTDPELYLMRHPLYITTPQVSSAEATIRIQAEVASRTKQPIEAEVVIRDQEGTEVVRHKERFTYRQATYEYAFQPIHLSGPKLWDCEQPHLYEATVTLYHPDGQVADCYTESFGIRSVEFSPAFGMKLNGKKVLLKGIANHHSLGALGAAAYPRAIEKRLQLLKSFGVNHIRTSHNPYSEDFMRLCDQYGMLVVDELYDKWLDSYCGGRTPWAQLWQQDIPEWIKRDRNHPSVVFWSLGNELQTYWNLPYADWGVTPYRMQRELLKRYDNTRLITVAMHPRGRHMDTDSLPAPLVHETDIAAYNYRYMYFPGDSKRFPNLIFYQSEANTSNMGPNFFEMDLEKVIGLAYWGQIDYLGESGGWPAKGWAQGAFDISLQPKPIAYLLKSMFSPEPVVHIGVIDSDVDLMWNDVQIGTARMSDHWNRKPGEILSLYTYTNTEEVELRVNGKSLGVKKNLPGKERNKIKWENIPYQAGYVEALGKNNGQIVARHRLETTGEARRLVVEPDNSHWKADGMDLQHLRIYAVDSKGRRVYHANHPLRFRVEGKARLVAVDNGDIVSDELHTQPQRNLFHGSALVILRSGQQADNTITLVTECEGLPTVRTRLQTE
ncbi:MAG: glycoside hydrolase family 2 TIM barrel-domain containing protein [Parabacteroides sp.]